MKEIIEFVIKIRGVFYVLIFLTLFIWIGIYANKNPPIYEITITDIYQDNGILGKSRYIIVYNSVCVREGTIWNKGRIGAFHYGKQTVDGATYRRYYKKQKFRDTTYAPYF